MQRIYIVTGMLLSGISLEALAGPGAGTIVFGAGNINPVPGLSGVMLVLLGLLLALVAFKLFKNRSNHTAFLVAALGAGAVLSSAGGVKIISQADAGFSGIVAILPNKTMSIHPADSNAYYNEDEQPMKVLSISLPPTCGSPTRVAHPRAGELCAVGDLVEPDENCSIQCPARDL